MALIHCPECNKEISDSVISCPLCGYPISKIKHQKASTNSTMRQALGVITKRVNMVI